MSEKDYWNIRSLATVNPRAVSSEVTRSISNDTIDSKISPTAQFSTMCYIGDAVIADYCVFEEGVTVLGNGTRIQHDTHVMHGAQIGSDVLIGPEVLICEGAKVCMASAVSGSSNKRNIGLRATIGPDVILHGDVALGTDAIIPTQESIAHIGQFGLKNRVITIYGSANGPLYSVGCRIGTTLEDFKHRAFINPENGEASASSYHPYFEAFDLIGTNVQKAYDREEELIDELLNMRKELSLPLPYAYRDTDDELDYDIVYEES